MASPALNAEVSPVGFEQEVLVSQPPPQMVELTVLSFKERADMFKTRHPKALEKRLSEQIVDERSSLPKVSTSA